MAIWPASPCVVHRGRRWIHRQTATSKDVTNEWGADQYSTFRYLIHSDITPSSPGPRQQGRPGRGHGAEMLVCRQAV